MNRLPRETRARIVHALCEGNGVRGAARLTGSAKGTVLRLLADIGEACARLHDETVRGINAKRVQCDEIWSFVAKKQKRVQPGESGAGDIWTWVGLDQDSKLAISWLVSDHSQEAADCFAADLAARVTGRVHVSTDGNSSYIGAFRRAFGLDIDHGMLVKQYAAGSPSGRYSPPRCVGAAKYRATGNPVRADICTSHVERSNLSMRMSIRRFTRLTNGFSRKAENHAHATALYFVFYNYCRPHHTLTKRAKGVHRTPAMQAGLTDRVWTVEDLLMLLPSERYRGHRAGAA